MATLEHAEAVRDHLAEHLLDGVVLSVGIVGDATSYGVGIVTTRAIGTPQVPDELAHVPVTVTISGGGPVILHANGR